MEMSVLTFDSETPRQWVFNLFGVTDHFENLRKYTPRKNLSQKTGAFK